MVINSLKDVINKNNSKDFEKEKNLGTSEILKINSEWNIS